MQRAISLAVVAALLALFAAAPTAGAAQACTKGAVESIVNGTIAVAKQQFRESANGSAAAWSCQFRLYDDNDDPADNPEVPHVFRASEWFFGGLFYWLTADEVEAFGVGRAGASALIDSVVDRLYWREQGGSWVELPLAETSHRSVLAPWGELLPVLHHRYHIFPAGSLAPGIYEWRFDQYDPLFDPHDFTAYGQVRIVP